MSKMNLDEIRFIYDDPKEYSITIDDDYFQNDSDIRNRRLKLSTQGLKISKELFPNIFKITEKINAKLNLDNEITYFIEPNNFHNAYCLPISAKESAVIINSGLVELLNDEEMEYIIGHEIGHHLFSHKNYPKVTIDGSENIGLKRLSQAAEISVDRIGLYCNNNLDACINCMMKIASGLKPPHINFDHKTFIDQLKNIVDLKGDRSQIYSTHPMIFVRAKALIIYSESKPYQQSINLSNQFKHTKKEMDTYVNDLISQSEGYAYDEEQSEEYNNIKMWAEVKLMISNNTWTNSEKKILEKSIGTHHLNKIDDIIKVSNQAGLNPLNEINNKWDNIKNSSLTKSKKEKLITELEILSKELIIMCNHKQKDLIESLSKISNDLGINKTIHINL